MQWARLAVGSCTALALAAIAPDGVAGRSGGASGGGGRSHGMSGGHAGVHPGHAHHFHHGGTRVFISAGFGAWPAAYYWPGYYYPPPYYYPYPAAVVPSAPQYWYYCPAAAAYYPYVQDCPGGWQLVLPTPPQQPY